MPLVRLVPKVSHFPCVSYKNEKVRKFLPSTGNIQVWSLLDEGFVSFCVLLSSIVIIIITTSGLLVIGVLVEVTEMTIKADSCFQ